jgi:hypothetical protein
MARSLGRCGSRNKPSPSHVVDGQGREAHEEPIASDVLVAGLCMVPRTCKGQDGLAVDPSPAPVEPSEIIAVFRSSKPEGAEKKVARGHKLEFVRWLDIGLTNGRAALYRIMDGRSSAEVLAALKRDPHVSAAQRNKRYRWSPH